MPYKDPAQKRAYHREYMRRRRAAVKPSPPPVLNPTPSQAGLSQRIDRSKPYTVEDRYPYPAYLVQDGFWFDSKTDSLVGEVK